MKKTVLELDLAGYSTIARTLEENLHAPIVLQFNQQIQSFVDAGLAAIDALRQKTVMATPGDGALLVFDSAEDAHRFAEAVHQATQSHNAEKTLSSARRWFRMGAATGDIAMESRNGGGHEIAGVTIANAVRLEAAARIGELVIDVATYCDLPSELKAIYGPEEDVIGKREEKFRARRCVMITLTDPGSLVPTEHCTNRDEESGIKIDTGKALIELQINREIDDFSQQQQDHLLSAIRQFLKVGEPIRVVCKRRGSVWLTLELSAEQAERLQWAVKGGEFAHLDVVDAKLANDLIDRNEPGPGQAFTRPDDRARPRVNVPGRRLEQVEQELDSGFRTWALRQLIEPAEALLDLARAVLDNARDYPNRSDHFVLSLERVNESIECLLAIFRRILEPGKSESSGIAFNSQLRHDIRSYVARIIGYCELWCEDVDAPFVKAFSDDLHRIIQITRDLVDNSIDDLLGYAKATIRPDSDQPMSSYAEVGYIAAQVDMAGRQAERIVGTLLVVADKEINRDILRRFLERQGHKILLAQNGRDALQLVRSQAFDLVLLDLIMPEMSGWQVLGQLKADPRLRQLPVLMISSLNEIDSLVRCIEMGADDYLSLPVNPVLLRARVNACLEKKRLRDRELSYLGRIKRVEKRARESLLAVLPEPIVKRLKGNRRPKPRRHRNVAILFADIVDFTSYCDQHEPEEVVRSLDELIHSWEQSALVHRVQKIRTSGDSFMAAAGLLEKVENPVLNCVRFGLDMIAAVQRLPNRWNVRVGIDFGPVVAGVVGSRQYLYDLWGSTVNTAARMESHGTAGAITLSMRAWRRVSELCRGSQQIVDVKGKGLLPTMRFEGFAS